MGTNSCVFSFFFFTRNYILRNLRRWLNTEAFFWPRYWDLFLIVGLGPVSERLAPTALISLYTDICYNKSNLAYKIKYPITCRWNLKNGGLYKQFPIFKSQSCPPWKWSGHLCCEVISCCLWWWITNWWSENPPIIREFLFTKLEY